MVNRILLIDVEKEWSQAEKDIGSHSTNVHYPIGLLYLASTVREIFPEITVKILHTYTSSSPLKYIKKLVSEFSPDLVGFRSLSIAQDHLKKIALEIRELRPNIPLIAGGPYPSTSFRELLTSAEIDLVVIGEGERTFADIISRIKKDGILPLDVPGTAIRDNSEVRLNSSRPPIEDIDSIPFPSHDFINRDDYAGSFNHSGQDSSKTALIVGSRGCPYNCIYCHKLFGRKVRHRSAENIVMEMREHFKKNNIRDFVFLDDIFNVPIKEAKKTLLLIIKKLPGIRICFPNGLRADQIDEELIDLLEKAGTVQVALAIETACHRLQKLIGKNLNIEKAYTTIQAMSRRFVTRVFFMIGFPTETFKEALETIVFAERLDHVSEPMLSIVTLYKNNPLFHMLQPNEQQMERLTNQEKIFFLPKWPDVFYYGDLFSEEKVPLKGKQIKELKLIWLQRVVLNPVRTANSHFIKKKFWSKQQLFNSYAEYFFKKNFTDDNYRNIEKRRWPRLMNGFATYSLPGQENLGRVCGLKNINEGGICIITGERISQQMTLILQVFLSNDNEPLKVKGRISWQQEKIIDSYKDPLYYLGIEFVELSDNDRERIHTCLIKLRERG